MRSQAILRRSQSLLKSSTAAHSASLPRLPRARRPLLVSSVSDKRLLSSVPPLSPSNPPEDPPETLQTDVDVSEPTPEDPEKPKPRRTRLSASIATKESEPLEWPEDLDILWLPDGDAVDPEDAQSHALPPPEIFEEALNNLLITLHPQTQHRATYTSASGSPSEPTLGLYCPIEGGDYVIDATVRELARRTGAEILVLDAVQLAAGEWGQFGKAASSVQLPRNPLHFPSSLPPLTSPGRNSPTLDDEDDPDNGLQMFSPPQQMTLTVMTPPTMQGRALMTSASRRSSTPSRIKVFFDTLVNMPSKQDTSEATSSSIRSKPRLIYIRDFPTLAPSSSTWYPPLLSAVRQRRRGPISRPSSAVMNPMTIVFGMTPSLTPLVPAGESGPSSGLMSLLMSRNASASRVSFPKPGRSNWSEDEVAEKAREKRLRERLRKWEKGDPALHEEFPRLSFNQDGDGDGGNKPEIIVIGGGSGMPGLPSMFGGPSMPSGSGGRDNDSDTKSPFFRSSILVPSTRSAAKERTTRVARRREINELTMRMGVGAVGGTIEKESAAVIGDSKVPEDTAEDIDMSSHNVSSMWDEWGNKVEVWSSVRKIADRALGSIMTSHTTGNKLDKPTLEPTVVPWAAVQSAWMAHCASRERRKVWMKEASPLSKALQAEPEHDEEELTTIRTGTDEVVERIKNDNELDSHEQRLLPCIVDSASMPTSFTQVHLPPHTIDSVRTIVSLPLIHPQAFQHGILKEHGMTGCLLFGPPGTGKTLVVRALAKEAGCRMITISPSDVMDMYVGEGEKLVRAVFSLARRLSPCVVFLDEIDALFGARMSARESGGAFAHRGVITEFMQEMDGLKSSRDDSVIVIGATNRPFDLDDAVLRRLPRRLLVDLPGEREREEILKILLRDEMLASDVSINGLAKKTESFSGSDLKHLCVSAALDAVKEHVHLPWVLASANSTSSTTVPDATQESKPSVESPPEGATSLSASSHSTATPAVIPGVPFPVPAEVSSDTLISSPAIDTAMELPSPNDQIASEPAARVLHLRNFTKALKEITPSSSESLGSLSELRKWNEEFGEGRRDRKKTQVWGKGRFGFIDHGKKEESVPVPATGQMGAASVENLSKDV